MSSLDHVLRLAKAYGKATGAASSTISWRVFGDTKKLDAILAGGDLTTRRHEAAMVWFRDNWPENATWPAGVPTPRSGAEQRGAAA